VSSRQFTPHHRKRGQDPFPSSLPRSVRKKGPDPFSSLLCVACLTCGLSAAPLYPPLKLAWQFHADGGFYSPPTLDGNQLFCGGVDGTVYVVTTTGELVWKRAVGGQLYGGAVADAQRVYAASTDKLVVALDRTTGEEQWRQTIDGLVYAAPRLVGDSLLVGTGDTGTVYCFHAATGEERWRFPLGARMGSGLEVADGMAYLPSFDSHLYAVDIAEGLLRWQFVAAGAIDSRPLAVGDRLYLKLGNDMIYALRRADGELLWQSGGNGSDPPSTPTNWSALTVADGRVYFGSIDARLHAVADQNGRDLWMTAPTVDRPSPPVPAGELGFAGDKDGCLSAVELESGRELWYWQPETNVVAGGLSGIMWPPVIVGTRLYAASLDGNLYAFDGQTDRAVWEASRSTTPERPATGQGWPDNLPAMTGPGVTPTEAEIDAVRQLGQRARGFVVWESNRDGAWDLYRLDLDGSGFRKLTDYAAKRSPLAYDGYLRPQLSPDGQHILYASGRRRQPPETWLVPSAGGFSRKLANALPLNWLPDGSGCCVAQDQTVLRCRLDDGRLDPLPGLELPAPADPRTVGAVQADGGLVITDPEADVVVPGIEPGEHAAFAKMAADGRWLVYGAAAEGQNHDVADYEIYLQELADGQPAGPRVRLTWHSGVDRWPDVYVEP